MQKKYKIQRRVKEHKKRLKKGVIAPGTNGTKKRAENHIPNAWPYKEQLLTEIQAAKEKMEELRLRQKEKRLQEIVSITAEAFGQLRHILTRVLQTFSRKSVVLVMMLA